MRKLLFAAAVVLTASSCNPCYNVECDAPDTDRIDGLAFEFGDTFSDDEVASAFVLFYAKGNLSHPLEAYDYRADLAESSDRTVRIQIGYPFTSVDDLSNFDFVISTQGAQKTFQITDVNSGGHYPTDCCCCYRNTDKTFMVNGTVVERSGSEASVILNR